MAGISVAQGLRYFDAGHRLGARKPGHRERAIAMADQRVPFATHADSTVLGADEIVLNMGPQHPSTHGVLRVKLRLDGEKVIGSECVIGSLHPGVKTIPAHPTYTHLPPSVY